MCSDVCSNAKDVESNIVPKGYALRLGDGLEFAEFYPALWRLTVYHILGVSRQVSLGYAEAYLLEYFVEHPGQMTTRQDLLDHAWGDRTVSQGSLNQAISNLRALLGDDQKREIILTVPRRGYQFSADTIIDWQEWTTRKLEIVGGTEYPVPAENSPLEEVPTVLPGRWQMPIYWGLSCVMLLSLLTGLTTSYFYTAFRPYVSEQLQAPHSQLTLLAENQQVLDATRDFLLPVFNRIESLGGGHVLINRVHNYLEINCLRPNGSLHTLLVHMGRIKTMDESHLLRCIA